MKLRIVTPTRKVVDIDGVVSVRAEDASGSFGIREGHTDFLTVLSVSVISWRGADGAEAFAAVRGGVLETRGGSSVEIATRDAVKGDNFDALRDDVLTRFRKDTEFEELSRTASAKLSLALIRQLQRYLEAGRLRVSSGAPLGDDVPVAGFSEGSPL